MKKSFSNQFKSIFSLFHPLEKSEIKKIKNEKDYFVEIGVNKYYNYVTENIDGGIYGYPTRSEILQMKGFIEAERCRRDPEVKSALETLIFSVLRKKILIKPVNDSDNALELKRFVEFVLKEIDGTIYDTFFELSSSVFYGYAIAEKIYKDAKHGEFAGKRIYQNIKGKRPGFYAFETDEFDNILSIHNLITFEHLPIDKFVIFTWMKTFSNPYGNPIFDSVWRFWWAKSEIIKQMLVSTGKFASASVAVKVDDNSDENLIQKAKEIADAVQSGAGIVIPSDLQIEFLHEGSKGENPYMPILKWLDTQIALSIIGNTLSTNENQSGGSYAQSKVHMGITELYANYLERCLTEICNEQIIRPLIEWNFDFEDYPIEIYPRVEFSEITEVDKKEFIETVKTATELGYLNNKNEQDMNFIRSVMSYPQIFSEEDVEKNKLKTEKNELFFEEK